MTVGRRAFRYIIRKRGKTLIIFSLLWVIATMALSGLSIQKATGKAALNLRQSLGGGFTMEQDTSDSSKWVTEQYENGNIGNYYTGQSVTLDMGKQIKNNDSRIKAYNATVMMMGGLRDKEGGLLPSFEVEDDILSQFYEENKSALTIIGNSDTRYSPYFLNNNIKLTEGGHITEADKDAVLVHKSLADKHKWKVGDTVYVGTDEIRTVVMPLTIVGIFNTKNFRSNTNNTSSAIENLMLTDVHSILGYYNKEEVKDYYGEDVSGEGVDEISFYIEDPAQLDDVVAKTRQIKDIEWNDFKLTVNDTAYDTAKKPLENMSKLVTTLIFLLLIIGGVILFLVLYMWIKGRTQETGILLSLGIGKCNIIGQYVLEVILVAAFAFGLAYCSSQLIAQNLGNSLLSYAASEEMQEEEDVGRNLQNSLSFTEDSFTPQSQMHAELSDIEVVVSRESLIWIYVIGFLLIILTVILASVPVMRLQPKEILSKMS